MRELEQIILPLDKETTISERDGNHFTFDVKSICMVDATDSSVVVSCTFDDSEVLTLKAGQAINFSKKRGKVSFSWKAQQGKTATIIISSVFEQMPTTISDRTSQQQVTEIKKTSFAVDSSKLNDYLKASGRRIKTIIRNIGMSRIHYGGLDEINTDYDWNGGDIILGFLGLPYLESGESMEWVSTEGLYFRNRDQSPPEVVFDTVNWRNSEGNGYIEIVEYLA